MRGPFALLLLCHLCAAGARHAQTPAPDDPPAPAATEQTAHARQPLFPAPAVDPRLRLPDADLPSLRPEWDDRDFATCGEPGECNPLLGKLVGGAVGVGGAFLYCSDRSCDAAFFALMFLGGYVGSQLGALIQCGPGAILPRPPY